MDQIDHIEKFKKTFFQECDELLGELETRINELRNDTDATEPLSAVFRVLHTIKGGAGMFGFHRIAGFAHVFENVLDRMRADRKSTRLNSSHIQKSRMPSSA